jgi:hypothetical protein
MLFLGEAQTQWLILLILAVDLALTLIHIWQEFKGRLWRYFGAIVDYPIPDWLGVSLFTVSLTIVLWATGIAAIAGPLLFPAAATWSVAALGALIGGRLSDSIFSHLRLRRVHPPNPGIQSVPYYLAEAAFLTLVFFPRLQQHILAASGGFAIGVLAFWSILPLLGLLRTRLLAWSS